MKKRSILYVVIVLIIGTAYFVIDSKLYYYGKSKYNIFNNSLPLGMNPDYWGADVSFPIAGLTIRDKYGLVLIGKDSYYLFDGDTIKVSRIIKYGISENKLMAFIEDDNKLNYFIECQKNTSPPTKKELIINVLNRNIEFEDDYKWIEFEDDKSKISRLVMIRAYTMLVAIVLIIVVPIIFLIRRRKK
jgi:hypothetical protein